MEQIIIQGGKKLFGSVKIEGGKNVILPILAATILADEGKTILKNVPILSDTMTMVKILRSLNANVEFNFEENEITVDATRKLGTEGTTELMCKIRSSILIMGSVLARNGYAKVRMPGGCAIGKRPIDLHLKGFQALGAELSLQNEYIEIYSDVLIGSNINLEFPSVGATENIMLAAVKSKGITRITNAAMEPEIIELAKFLNAIGARITGHGTGVIRIEGVGSLRGAEFSIIQDRIESGTFMIAAAITGGNILVEKAVEEDNEELISKLRDTGAIVIQEQSGVRVVGSKYIKPLDIATGPHPGFPTDLQAQISVLLAIANGVSTITETIYENRFQHLSEMTKMGANVFVTNDTAIIKGTELFGAKLSSTDLRAGAALVIAGLGARGVTYIDHLEYIDRGYYKFVEKLQRLGADIKRSAVNGKEGTESTVAE